jgi:hypothetical protein
MRFVMVPVPQEHVLEVMRWVLFRSPEEDASLGVRDRARLAKLLDNLDELTRSLLLLLAKATVDGTAPVRLTDAADELERPADDLRAALRQLDTPMRHVNVRTLVMLSDETAVGVHGNKGKITFLSMRPEDARVLWSAGKAVDDRGE